MTTNEAIEWACEAINVGWSIEIEIENGYVGVTLLDPDGEGCDMHEGEMNIEAQIQKAVRISNAS